MIAARAHLKKSRGRLPALLAFACAMGVALVASSATAQELAQETIYVPPDELPVAEPERNKGWNGRLSINANLNLASNSNVVGQVDGFSTLIGFGLQGALQYKNLPHRWTNNLSVNQIWAKTPVLDEFVKSNDLVAFESLYNWFAWAWGGAFARASAETALFTTRTVTADPQDYAPETDATAVNATSSFRLSDPFQPLTLTESAGVFLEPVERPEFTLSLRAGFGGRHTFAEGARVLVADSADPILFTELQDVHQAGAEGFAGAEGALQDGRITYGVGLSALVPFLNNDDTDRSAFELTKLALVGRAGTTIFSWMSLDYELKVVNDPQLIDEVQIQNSLLLTVAFTPVDTFTPPPEDDPLAEAEARAEAAEQRAREAEQRAAQAEAALEGGATAAPPTEPESATVPAAEAAAE